MTGIASWFLAEMGRSVALELEVRATRDRLADPTDAAAAELLATVKRAGPCKWPFVEPCCIEFFPGKERPLLARMFPIQHLTLKTGLCGKVHYRTRLILDAVRINPALQF